MTVSELFGIKPKKEKKKAEVKENVETANKEELEPKVVEAKPMAKTTVKEEQKNVQEKEHKSKLKETIVSKTNQEAKTTFNKNFGKNNNYDNKTRNNDSKGRIRCS